MGSYDLTELKVVSVPAGGEDAAWNTIRAACPYLSDWGMGVLRSGLDGHVKSVVVEKSYVCKDFRNIYSHFYSKKLVSRSPICSRLHFFNAEGLSANDVVLNVQKHRPNYIGFAVVQPAGDSRQGRCLGRTILDPFKCGHSPATTYCLRTKFTTQIQGAEYHVEGYPYMSQSGEAIVCAHTALWGVCRYLSERHVQYAELYPYDVILMTGDASGRRVPYHGLSYNDYSTILSNFGAHPVLRHPTTFGVKDWKVDKNTFFDIYAYVESGFPVLLSFRGHVATAIGHTMRKDLAFSLPDANGFHDSYALLDQYIVVDDNFFPYQKLGDVKDGVARNYGKHFESQLKPHPSKSDIYAAVIPLPETAFMEPDAARKIASSYFGSVQAKKRLDDSLKALGIDPKEPIITRLFLTSSRPFKRRKLQAFLGTTGLAPDSLSQLPLKVDLPHFVWVMEISPLSLYQKQIIVGEIVIDATADLSERGLVYARVGNELNFGSKVLSDPAAAISFRQYTHNLGER